jgi:transcription antitermination factor NusG
VSLDFKSNYRNRRGAYCAVTKKALPEVGETIKVVVGLFQDIEGTVAEVKPQEGKVRVPISLFGRAYPLELDLVQTEKT